MTSNNTRTPIELLASITEASQTAAAGNQELRKETATTRIDTNKRLTEADAALQDALALFEEAEAVELPQEE